jgi:hypothetical protein
MNMEIARIILEQIKAIDPWALGAYGTQNLISLPESIDYAGGLSFSVNGLNHQGTVFIHLKWTDEYKIVFVSNEGVIVKEVDGVYCDMLIEVLDFIEIKETN